jgi:predicted acylesterase/phospholipase RssA
MTSGDESIGISLSGGGHRATLFALGALLAIVDLGRNSDVNWINSVSGGSIANAYVAANCEYSAVTLDEFSSVCMTAVNRISRTGSVTGGLAGRFRVALFFIALLSSVSGMLYFSFLRETTGYALAAGCYLAGLTTWRLRGYIVELGIRDAWCRSSATGRTVYLGENPRTVEHIFSTVDIRAALPVFLSDSYMADGSDIFLMKRLSMARAVRASAAFPGILPPVRMRLDRLTRRKDGSPAFDSRTPRRQTAYLVDGGVYNNLGTEWPIRAGSYSHNTDHLLMKERHHKPVSVHLVVDSSARDKISLRILHEIPVIGSLYSIARTYKATYESTLESARRYSPPGGDVRLVTITERPGWGRLVPDKLKMDADSWRFAAWTTRATKTTLSRINQRHAIRIMAHGYALTLMTLGKFEDLSVIGSAWTSWLGAEVLESLSFSGASAEKEKMRLRVVSQRRE